MDVRLPSLGEEAESGTVASIFVAVGDSVDKDQALIELESEKAVASVPSPAAGRITAVHVKEGDEIGTGALLVTLETSGKGEAPVRAAAAPAPERTPKGEPAEERAGKPERDSGMPFPPTEPRIGPIATKPPSPAPQERPLPEGVPPAASPTIRKLARDLGIDLTRVRGTARGGRIVLGDLRDYIARLQRGAEKPSEKAAEPATAPSIDFSRWGPVETSRVSTIRKTIAARMVESWTRIPHVTQFADADITRLTQLRRKHRDAFQEKGARLTLTPVVLRALVRVLAKHPLLNSSLDEASMSIVTKGYYHIGVAVDTEAGLIVPVIRDVDQKSLFDLAKEVEALGERARNRQVTREEMQGGTFTLSNQGGIGGSYFTPIINYPEVAILGIGRGRNVVDLVDGKPVARMMLPLALSHDHRVVDGADGVRFLVDLVGELEEISESDFELS